MEIGYSATAVLASVCTTFRVSNMGDETDATISELLGWMTECLPG